MDDFFTTMQPSTSEGRTLLSKADELGPALAARAGDFDRSNSYVRTNIEALQASNFLGGPAPSRLGGGGVTSVRDLTIALTRVGRSCGSTALGATMHMVAVWMLSRMFEQAENNDALDPAFEGFVTQLATSRLIMSGAGTEPGGNTFLPRTTLRRNDGRWILDGHKVFATNCEMADLINVRVAAVEDGAVSHGFVRVSPSQPGVEVQHDWDAMGMRGTGSHGIRFNNCVVADEMVSLTGPLGAPNAWAWLNAILPSTVPLLGTYVGIAQQARQIAIENATSRSKHPYPGNVAAHAGVQHRMGELDNALNVAVSTLDRTSQLLDALLNEEVAPSDETTMQLVANVQSTKLAVDTNCVAVVDHAMTIVGGGAYDSRHPLSRLYRDVRAGGFMQPYSPIEAYSHIGATAFGLDPLLSFSEAAAIAIDDMTSEGEELPPTSQPSGEHHGRPLADAGAVR